MNKVAKFEKVSREEFYKQYEDELYSSDIPGAKDVDREQVRALLDEMYDGIKLPVRATTGSAGYDICSPLEFDLAPNESVRIPTGIRAKIEEGWWLSFFPRSGLSHKYGTQFINTVPVIDADYYNSSNEGHIILTIHNRFGQTMHINSGDRFAQGVFLPFGITEDDEATGERDGGFGSTGK